MSFRFLFLLLPIFTVSSINSQIKSDTYKKIVASDSLKNSLKEVKIDSLILSHIKLNRVDYLIGDIYDFARWQKKYGTIDRSIELNHKCLHYIDSFNYQDIYLKKKAYYNLAVAYKKKSDYLGAYKYFNEIAEIKDIDKLTYKAYRLRADNVSFSGDYYRAAQLYKQAMAFTKKHEKHEIFLDCSVNAALNFRKINTEESLNQGIKLLHNAIDYLDGLNNKSNTEDISLTTIISIYLELGILYSDRENHDYEKSKANYDKALEYALILNDSIDLANIYNGIGFLHAKEKKKEALLYLNKALTYIPYIKTTQVIYKNKSAHFLNFKEKDSAFLNIQKSINTVAPFDYSNFNNLPDRQAVLKSNSKFVLLYSLVDKAELCIEFAKLNENKSDLYNNALKTLKLADFLLDVIRLETNNQESKLFWRKIASDMYIKAVHAANALKKHDEAFYYMEKAKAILLLENITKNQLLQQANLPKEISERQQFLKNSIIKHTYSQWQSNISNDSVQDLLIEAKENYYSFVDSLDLNYKLYFKSSQSPKIITLEEVQKDIRNKNEAFIEYIVNEKEAFGMFIDKNTIEIFNLGDVDSLKVLSNKFRELLETPFRNQQDIIDYNQVTNKLYNILIPLNIKEKSGRKKLTIIPDYFLQNIPFDALQTSSEFGSYAIKDHEISYGYSISFLKGNSKINRKNSNLLLGIAPIVFQDNLSNLPHTKNEIEAINKIYSSTMLTGNKASKKAFKTYLSDYKIIHVASHASTLDNANPWIAFSDGKLTLEELYNSKNNANLVVLSACETSLGQFNQGEGVMSLARGFFNTGSESVISTLWNVNDKSSSIITKHFYENLKDGKTKSLALHNAKLEYLKTHSLSETSPYYWSSFILIGDSGTLSINHNNILLFVLIFISILLIICCLIFTRVKK